MILDHTIQLGKEKCLVVLGVTVSKLKEVGYCLKHQDVRVLGMDIVGESNGEFVAEYLDELTPHFGVPCQIVSDHGSDLKKGITLYHEQWQEVIHTYDITHGVAALLKKEFKENPRWKEFTNHAAVTASKLRQTELECLIPPRQREKARFINMGKLVKWAEKLLAYGKRGCFDVINPAFFLSMSEAQEIAKKGTAAAQRELPQIAKKFYMNREVFEQAQKEKFSELVLEEAGEPCLQMASLGRKRYQEKLSWLEGFEKELPIYVDIFRIADVAMECVKKKGLNGQTAKHLAAEIQSPEALTSEAKGFAMKVVDFIEKEGSKVQPDSTWLGTSDIIESLFGKYKLYTDRSPSKTLGDMLLTLPLITQKCSTDVIKSALETVSVKELEQWSQNTFGISSMAKRRLILNTKAVLA